MPYKKQKATRSNKKCYLRPNDRFGFKRIAISGVKVWWKIKDVATSWLTQDVATYSRQQGLGNATGLYLCRDDNICR